jgi:hypothetical protein
VTTRTTRLEWSFAELPDDCRPVQISLGVVNASDVGSTPTVRDFEVDGATGRAEITYPDFLPPPNVALASAYAQDGHRSRSVKVRIARAANTPPDPPEPLPPVTASAGEPVTCTGPATVVDEPAGDVLTYDVGKPPTQVGTMTPQLSGIDITRAAVQIDGRTVCATLTFARPPTDGDLEVSLNLHDTTQPSCCTTLRFRRTAGRLEVGTFSIAPDGTYRLSPTTNGGAEVRSSTLVVTGDFADPSTWQRGALRMPEVENLGWSITTRSTPEKYGPSFGDWLPRHEGIGQPFIRHRDGAMTQPGG